MLSLKKNRKVPTVIQGESSECGLACIAMLLCYYGQEVELKDLRKLHQVSSRGLDLSTLIKIADQHDLDTRAIRCSLDNVRKLRAPAILHWNHDHYVVLVKANKNKWLIIDPVVGKRTIDIKEASSSFTGVALETSPRLDFKISKSTNKFRIVDLMWDLHKSWRYLLQIAVLTILVQIFLIVAPIINQIIIDDAIAKSDIGLLYVVIVAFGALKLTQVLIEALRSWVEMYFGALFSERITTSLIGRLLSIKPDFFEKRDIGDIMSRISSLRPIQELVTKSFVAVLLDGLMVVITLFIMIIYSSYLTAIVVAVVVLRLTSRLISFRYYLSLEETKLRRDADLETTTLETVRGMRAIKLFGKEYERLSQWRSEFSRSINAGISVQKYRIVSETFYGISTGFSELVVYLVGASLIISGELTLGMFFAFQAYRLQFSNKSDRVLNLIFEFKTASLHILRLSDLLTAEVDEKTATISKSTQNVAKLIGKIEFRDVSFSYGQYEEDTLKNVSFVIEPGERVGFVGPSGGGKSTLIKLLVGLHSPTSGEIYIDDRNISSIGSEQFRSSIGVIMQDDRLFAGSLYDNISFLEADPNLERVEAVARVAQLYPDIMQMPLGFHSQIGDMGSALSGGQVQRLLLARALYGDPAILILDEGTANLDNTTEKNILNFLQDLKCTQVVVAHRSEAILHCSRLLEVRNGNVTTITSGKADI